MNVTKLVDTLVDAIPLHRTISWSSEALKLTGSEFEEAVERLYELDRAGSIDLLSVTRISTQGFRRASAAKFVHIQRAATAGPSADPSDASH